MTYTGREWTKGNRISSHEERQVADYQARMHAMNLEIRTFVEANGKIVSMFDRDGNRLPIPVSEY